MELKLGLITVTLWLGFVLAISFFETPIRFSAPLVDMKIGVSIGQLLFNKLHQLEWLFLICTMALCLRKNTSAFVIIFFGVLLVLLITQNIFLKELDKRANALLQGEELARSIHHTAYVVLEVVKAISLLFLINLIVKKLKF